MISSSSASNCSSSAGDKKQQGAAAILFQLSPYQEGDQFRLSFPPPLPPACLPAQPLPGGKEGGRALTTSASAAFCLFPPSCAFKQIGRVAHAESRKASLLEHSQAETWQDLGEVKVRRRGALWNPCATLSSPCQPSCSFKWPGGQERGRGGHGAATGQPPKGGKGYSAASGTI